MKDESKNNTDLVLQFIQENPGCHLRQITRVLNLSMGTIQYHLNLLQNQGKISSERHQLFRYYFPIGIFEQREKDILKILNQETAREIIMIIVEKKRPTQSEIANSIGVTSPTVNWHIKRLVNLGLVLEEKEGKFIRYSLKIEPKHVVSLMKNYHSNIWSDWSNRLAEMFLDLSNRGDKE